VAVDHGCEFVGDMSLVQGDSGEEHMSFFVSCFPAQNTWPAGEPRENTPLSDTSEDKRGPSQY
jgi:hypothetical protein